MVKAPELRRRVVDALDLEPDERELLGQLLDRCRGVEMILQPGEREFHGRAAVGASLPRAGRDSPPPCGEGLGVGVERRASLQFRAITCRSIRHSGVHPHPRPFPARAARGVRAHPAFVRLGRQPARQRRHVERREAVVPQPAQVGGEHVAQIGDAVFQHGDAVEAHAEGEALVLVGIEAAVADDVGVHHAAAQDLQPLARLADGGGVDVHLHGRLGEREVRGAEAHAHLVDLEERLAELLQAPLEVAEVRGLVDHQPLDLVEHRRVRGVAVDAVDAARRDDADRRLLRHHGADLHRARMRAQHHDADAVALPPLALHVEGVVLLPGGVLGRDVELGEVEVVGLDVGPLGDGEAHVAEDLDDLVEHLAHRMDAPILQRPGAHRQRDVGLLGGEAGRERAALQIGLAAFQRVADARLEAVDGLPEGLALVSRAACPARHQLRDAALLAERGDAHALDRGEVAGGGDLGDERAFERGEIGCLCHPFAWWEQNSPRSASALPWFDRLTTGAAVPRANATSS